MVCKIYYNIRDVGCRFAVISSNLSRRPHVLQILPCDPKRPSVPQPFPVGPVLSPRRAAPLFLSGRQAAESVARLQNNKRAGADDNRIRLRLDGNLHPVQEYILKTHYLS